MNTLDTFVIKRPRLSVPSTDFASAHVPPQAPADHEGNNISTCPSRYFPSNVPNDQISDGILGRSELTVQVRDSTVQDYILTAPYQPRNILYPIDKRSRKFLVSWYDQFKWLEWDSTSNNGNGAAFCHFCRIIAGKGISIISKPEDSFSKHGYTGWKNAIRNFKKHENSEAHRDCKYRLLVQSKGENVAAQLNTQQLKQRHDNTNNLRLIFTSLSFLAKQGISIQGHDNDTGNFLQLMKLRSTDNPSLKTWLERKLNWTSHDIQNEILALLSLEVLRELINKIKECEYFGLMADETTDASQTEQMVICLRVVPDNLVPEEIVLGLYSLTHCDAKSIFATVVDVLKRCSLDLKNCRAQCYDGASTFQGSKNGVIAKVLNAEARAVSTHCHMHCVNLAVQEAVTKVPLMRDFLNLIQDIINCIRCSPKRIELLKTLSESLNCKQTHVRPLCPTRFTVKFRALEAIYKQIKVLPKALLIIENDANEIKVRSQVSGFRRYLEEFDFCFCLQFGMRLFELTDRLSKSLQTVGISVGQGVQLVTCCVNQLKLMRTDGSFDEIWRDSKNLSQAINSEPPKLPRQTRAPIRFENNTGNTHVFQSPSGLYKSKYFEILDIAIVQLEERIIDKAIPVIIAIEGLLRDSYNGQRINENLLDVVCEHFKDDLDRDRLKSQLMCIETITDVGSSSSVSGRKNSKEVRIIEIINIIGNCGIQKVMITQVVKLCKLYLVCPASTATPERTFSKLRQLKTYLRSTMNQTRLNHLMLLSIYSEKVDNLNLNKLMNEFISNGDTKRTNTFASVVL